MRFSHSAPKGACLVESVVEVYKHFTPKRGEEGPRLQSGNKLPHSEFPLSEVSDNFRPDPFPNRNRDTIPDHPVRIVRAADESKCVRHTLEARVFSNCVRSHALWKSSIDDQSGAQVFRVMRHAGGRDVTAFRI